MVFQKVQLDYCVHIDLKDVTLTKGMGHEKHMVSLVGFFILK
jgi:hypothetical protein